jgi:hypothetical protein
MPLDAIVKQIIQKSSVAKSLRRIWSYEPTEFCGDYLWVGHSKRKILHTLDADEALALYAIITHRDDLSLKGAQSLLQKHVIQEENGVYVKGEIAPHYALISREEYATLDKKHLGNVA